MAYKDTILEICGIRWKKTGETDILLPALCDTHRRTEQRVVHSAGMREPYAIFPGPAEVTGSIKDFPLYDGIEGVLDLIVSDTDGQMKPVEVDDGDGRYDGFLTQLRISIPYHDAVTCNIDWTGNNKSTSSITGSVVVSDPFIGTGVALSGVPSTFDFESIDITVSNKVTQKYSARGISRLPSHLAQGYLDVEMTIKFNEFHGIDVLANDLLVVDTATIQIKTATGTKTLTITLSKLLAGDDPRTMNEEDIVDYGLVYKATNIAFAVA